MTPEIRNPGSHPSIQDLRTIPVFKDLQEEHLLWLAGHMTNEPYANGEVLVQQGSPADYMVVIFEGELQAQRKTLGKEAPLYIARAGTVTGKLPFSRMKEYPSTVRALGSTRVGRLYESDFPQMLATIPGIGEVLVGVLSDRVREVTKVDLGREKLAALGKLSAGLAHELNNPASAAKRAAAMLRESLQQLAIANRKLAMCPMTEEQREMLAAYEEEMAGHADSKPVLDTLALSDREQELIQWFDRHGIDNGWEIAPVLAETGLDRPCLEEVLSMVGNQVLGTALQRTTATFTVERLLREIENSMDRISNLVKAVKEYSYMDQSTIQEVDLNRSLDNTLAVMNFRFKHGVSVIREYDSALPRICANGSELNSIWTNLIDNAVDAMNGKGELRVRTARENDLVLIEVIDNGPGVPPEVQSRIFDPFFTTKGVGHGTGLGLELVYRIVTRHHGDIRLTSEPGRTCFAVRLPLKQPVSQTKDAQDEEVFAYKSNP